MLEMGDTAPAPGLDDLDISGFFSRSTPESTESSLEMFQNIIQDAQATGAIVHFAIIVPGKRHTDANDNSHVEDIQLSCNPKGAACPK
jgi:hypothetical protein